MNQVTLESIDAKLSTVVETVSEIKSEMHEMKKEAVQQKVDIALLTKRAEDLEKADEEKEEEIDLIWGKIRNLNLTRASWIGYLGGALGILGAILWAYEHLIKKGTP